MSNYKPKVYGLAVNSQQSTVYYYTFYSRGTLYTIYNGNEMFKKWTLYIKNDKNRTNYLCPPFNCCTVSGGYNRGNGYKGY